MFMGEYNHSVDAKGRTIVPAKLREGLGETFVITTGLDGCLFVYSLEEWEKFEQKMQEQPQVSNSEMRKVIRFFLSGAMQCEVDKQGRILIPSNLREFAGLTKDIVFIGALNRVEIWDKAKWDECNIEYNDNMNDVIADMEKLGFNF